MRGATLYTNDYLEYYLTLIGWVVHNGIWNTLVATSLIAVPFLAVVIQEWLRARGEGADEGNKGMLSTARVENRIWVAVMVLMFAGLPVIDVSMDTIKFDMTRSKQCQVMLAEPGDTGWSQSFTTVNQQSARVPLWWFFMHTVSKAVTGAAVAAIPCGTDLRQMRMDIDSARIADPVLSQEVADFSNDCYGPARAKLFMSRPTLNDAQMYDVTWIGSRQFLNNPGYYDTYHSRTPRTAWPYNATRDAGLAQVPSGGGYPTCQQWWNDGGKGLRARLLAQVDSDLLTRVGKWASFIPREQADDAIIRAIAAPRKQNVNSGHAYTDYGGQIDATLPNAAGRIAGDVGLAVGSLGFFPAMDVMRQALPMALSFLKAALVICIPFVLLFSALDLKTTVTVSVVQFSLYFVDFWYQLARWVDSTILDALYGWGFGADRPHTNFNPLLGLDNGFGDLLMNFVTATMFLVLPSFWVMALAWAGVRAGNFVQGLAAATSDAKSAGGKAGQFVGGFGAQQLSGRLNAKLNPKQKGKDS
ncbi:conjugal transfer protein TraG N-terminal domain-containing protein [Burkholderia pyrrocinia]|uniref:conjugal transfer protein TraG N-terminal domain-containing protein n=1 Tax=Burkholderia pyrrocinia TaxID=60550 RepID=UPI001FB305B3|nr:conjugal transfer protein TraG N-terminal domain-containing protein [Burkholderia pyrrocinia]UOB56991.1 conjugal transfer protein TraG N-terminal domain-containing protein [Burkholderia pyrrocinia]